MRHPRQVTTLAPSAASLEVRLRTCAPFKHKFRHSDTRSMGVRLARGYTIVELMIALGVLTIVAAIAIPGYLHYRERAAARSAVTQLGDIAKAIKLAEVWDRALPRTLEDVLGEVPRDPWGNPYEYLPFDAGIPGWKGKRRKDKNLVPINSRFDLYSRGPDGDSKPPLTAKPSLDDIVYANDGRYIGPASDY
jgi:general secretion pathway protein G